MADADRIDMLNIITSNNSGASGSKEEKTNKRILSMLIDSLIIGGITVFSTWTGALTLDQLVLLVKSFGISFLIQLAYYRGIKKAT